VIGRDDDERLVVHLSLAQSRYQSTDEMVDESHLREVTLMRGIGERRTRSLEGPSVRSRVVEIGVPAS
jgi:hypothetical protein